MNLRLSILKLSSLSFLFLFNINSLSQEEQFIEDIIVTAEKRNESLQTVSQADTAITDSELEAKNITSFLEGKEVENLIPPGKDY